VITCGVWSSTERRLVAVILDDAARARKPIFVPRSTAAADGLVEYLAGEIEAEIVLPESLLGEPIGRAAARSGRLWLAPRGLVDAVRQAAALSPRASAAMLARLPRIRSLRRELRHHNRDPRQLVLLP